MSKASKTVQCDLAASGVHVTSAVSAAVAPPPPSAADREARRARYGYPVSDRVLDHEAAARAAVVPVVNAARPDVSAAQAAMTRYMRRTYGAP